MNSSVHILFFMYLCFLSVSSSIPFENTLHLFQCYYYHWLNSLLTVQPWNAVSVVPEIKICPSTNSSQIQQTILLLTKHFPKILNKINDLKKVYQCILTTQGFLRCYQLNLLEQYPTTMTDEASKDLFLSQLFVAFNLFLLKICIIIKMQFVKPKQWS